MIFFQYKIYSWYNILTQYSNRLQYKNVLKIIIELINWTSCKMLFSSFYNSLESIES